MWMEAEKKLPIESYADEFGYIVRNISPDGYLWLEHNQLFGMYPDVRQWPALLPLSQPVSVLGERGGVPGLPVGASGHVLTTEQRQESKIGWDDVFVDSWCFQPDIRIRLPRWCARGTSYIVWSS
jgi:putative aminopeptidase FrvX